MTIELLVPPRTQISPMSCWWASMAMILEYYGYHYLDPSSYRSAFARPFNRPITNSPYPDQHFLSLDQAMRRDSTLGHDPGRIQRRERQLSVSYSRPYEWFHYGIPRRSRHAFELLSEITGFRGFDRPAFGEWTAEDIESRLRQYGPYAFFGFWNGNPHVIVLVGIIQQNSEHQVVTIDPARGFATTESLASFNARMDSEAMSEFNFNGLNPLYLPQENPIREIVNH